MPEHERLDFARLVLARVTSPEHAPHRRDASRRPLRDSERRHAAPAARRATRHGLRRARATTTHPRIEHRIRGSGRHIRHRDRHNRRLELADRVASSVSTAEVALAGSSGGTACWIAVRITVAATSDQRRRRSRRGGASRYRRRGARACGPRDRHCDPLAWTPRSAAPCPRAAAARGRSVGPGVARSSFISPTMIAIVGVRDIEALVEHLRRHQHRRRALAEPLQRPRALGAADLVRDRHDQQLARDRIRGRVVAGEHERALAEMSREELAHRHALALGIRDHVARALPRRERLAPELRSLRHRDELVPAPGLRFAQPRPVRRAEPRAQLAIPRALLAIEPDQHRLVRERWREPVPDEIRDAERVHHRPQLRSGLRRRGREPERRAGATTISRISAGHHARPRGAPRRRRATRTGRRSAWPSSSP